MYLRVSVSPYAANLSLNFGCTPAHHCSVYIWYETYARCSDFDALRWVGICERWKHQLLNAFVWLIFVNKSIATIPVIFTHYFQI